MYLDLNVLPEYIISSYRVFEKGEHHITRICDDDVLLLVFDGVLKFYEDGNKIELKRGEYYIQRRSLLQEGREASEDPKYYYIHFKGNTSEVPSRCPLRGSFNLDLMRIRVEALEESKLNSKSKISIYQSFYSIISSLSSNIELSSTAKNIADYIKNNFKSDLSLDALASRFGYCKNYIIKIFKKEFNKTPHGYITMLRVDIAKNLLVSSSLSIDEVATECGFETYINLYKAFISAEKCSPGEYRAKINR